MITIIAEKKNQAKQYLEAFKFLGVRKIQENTFDYQFFDAFIFKDQVSISWTDGHILKSLLPEEINAQWKFDAIDQLPFFPERLILKVDPKKEALFHHIKQLVSKSTQVVLGGDADREGALIQIELAEHLGLFEQKKPMKRLRILETGPKEVVYRLQHLETLDFTFKQYLGAVARQFIDWETGMNLSPIYTHVLKQLGYDDGTAYPVGRIKSVVLYMIHQRNEAFESFTPEVFYQSVAYFGGAEEYVGRLVGVAGQSKKEFEGRFFESDGGLVGLEAFIKANQGQSKKGVITKLETKEKQSQSPALFTTRSLQKAMGKVIPDGVETINVAESLYNMGFITYPRTSSNTISKGLFERLASKALDFQQLLGDTTPLSQLNPRERYVNVKGIQNKAHEAITITDKVPLVEEVMNWSKNQQLLYMTILERCIAMFLPDFKYQERTIITTVGKLDYQTKENLILDLGFKALYGYSLPDEQALFPVKLKDEVEVSFDAKEGHTNPLPQFTRLSILDAMAQAGREIKETQLSEALKAAEGLGTEATRAGIVKEMIDKGLLNVIDQALELTDKGLIEVFALQTNPELCQPLLTAKWEQEITQIEEGRLSLAHLKEKNEAFIRQAIQKAKRLRRAQLPDIDLSWGRCPKCGGALLKKKWAVQCQNDCEFKVQLEIGHKKLSDPQLRKLIEEGQTKLIKGFKGQKGKFDAFLVLNEDFETIFEFENQKKESEAKL